MAAGPGGFQRRLVHRTETWPSSAKSCDTAVSFSRSVKPRGAVEQAEVSVDELLGGLKRRGLPLPFEIGAFIALEACEQIVDRPVRFDSHDIGIGDIGEVVFEVKKAAATEE